MIAFTKNKSAVVPCSTEQPWVLPLPFPVPVTDDNPLLAITAVGAEIESVLFMVLVDGSRPPLR